MIRSMISHAISQAYPDAAIYKEQASQITRPAFYIGEIEANEDRRIGNHYRRIHNMVVRYFPVEDNLTDYEDLSAIADKLYAHLEYLNYDIWRGRGYNRRHRIEDNVLQFFVTIQVALKRQINNPKMGHIETNEILKE